MSEEPQKKAESIYDPDHPEASPINGHRPPLETRWKPGCPSPNPKGRPSGIKRALRDLLSQQVNGGTSKTNAEAIAEVAIQKALRGNFHYFREILNRTEGAVPLEVGGDLPAELSERLAAKVARRYGEPTGN